MSAPIPTTPAPTDAHRPSRVRRNKALNLALAIFFFLLGFVGLLIPVMPQILFFAMGILFLSLVSPTVRRRVRRFLHQHPKLAHAYKRWRNKGRQKRREMIRQRKALAQRMHMHRRESAIEREGPPGSG